MVRVGVHLSIAGGVDRAVSRALSKGCDTFQIFSRNPRGWRAKELESGTVERFVTAVKDSGIHPVVVHMPYLPNLACPNEDVYLKSVDALSVEIKRCSILKIPYLVTHLGSHLGSGLEKGYLRAADGINKALSKDDSDVILLLENTAGTKNSVGGKFEDIRAIMDRIEKIDRIGICFDTCHAYAAGYDVRTREGLNTTLKRFDELFGISTLRLLHLNDSKGGLGSGRDRHEHIGLGRIGENGFREILHDPRLRDLPMILETPVDRERDDAWNMAKVRELAR